MTIYVTNLPPDTTKEELAKFFKRYGPLVGVVIWERRTTGELAGVIDMHEGKSALTGANGSVFRGRKIVVSDHRPFDPD
jgi:RNA recognition motif-containing protein